MLDILNKWLNARLVTDAQEAIREGDAQKVMVGYAKERGT